ncbi:hypothetical protein MCOR25_005420 [Pyricularia grisea]|nr:hypothetical protein MCOR25_005420 [Pyricularia grisea]
MMRQTNNQRRVVAFLVVCLEAATRRQNHQRIRNQNSQARVFSVVFSAGVTSLNRSHSHRAKSSGGSWFRNPFSSSNSDGASENAGSPVAEPAQDPGRGFDGPVGVGTQPIQTSMSPTVKSAAPGIDPASTLLNRQSRRRLRNYDTKEQKRIDTLNLTKQPIPPNDPSLLGITNPVERLRAYDARRDRQRQEQIRSDQAIKNGLLGQKGPLSAEEKKLLDNYDQIEMKNNAKSRILGITDPRKRLVQYKLRDKNKKPLTPMEQQRLEEFDRIEKQNPSSRILKTADPAARLKKYNDREAQRQKNAAAKNKSQPPRGQRGKAAVNSPLAPQQSTPNQPPKKQQVAKPIQENKQIASPAVKQPSRRVRKAQRKEAAATATATAAAQMAKAAPAGTTTSKQATSAPGNKAPQGPNRRERKAQMKVYVADAARKEKAARAAEAQKRLQEKKSATSVGVAAVKTQSTGKPEPMSEKEKAKANENMAAFANLPGLV